jgi:hypothetical protein
MVYMASNKNKTGPIKETVEEAAISFFEKYPDRVCYVSEGLEVGPMFIVPMRNISQEVRREHVNV